MTDAETKETKSPIADLVKALKSDAGYRQTWESSLSMAFVDECAAKGLNGRWIIEASQDAATTFLDWLIKQHKP